VVSGRTAEIQYAALPWRKAGQSIEILLITTRNTRRWIVPKGWPLPDCTPQQCAAFEALEEAGVIGEVNAEPIGSFRYDKLRKNGNIVSCKVQVFPLKVTGRKRAWPEKRARDSRWCPVAEAVARVSEPGLKRVIARFAIGFT
jgi:8-oxo-dGTP pyrophosphatase MutT (NUDIX family)